MNILIVTLIQRRPNGTPLLFPSALQSIYDLTWCGKVDYYSPASVDGDDPVTVKYNAARQIFLAGEWDAMLCAESDMILPVDTLEHLTALDCDIAYGLYCWRYPSHEWTAYTDLRTKRGLSLSANADTARATFGQVIEVKGVGLGCTLIHRHVLKALEFRASYGAACDWSLAIDAQHYGLKQLCDTGLVCGHIDRDGKTVYYPDPNAAGLVRTETL